MKTREYFLEAGRGFVRSAVMLGKGCYFLGRHLFTNWPNATWFCICMAIAVAGMVKVGQARVERDGYSYSNAVLVHKVDSLENLR